MPVEERVREYLNGIRRRMRLATTARGFAVVGVAALLLTVLAVLWANAWRFSDTAVRFSRAVLWLTTILLLIHFLVRPLLRRISDARLARFVEEKHPELRDRLVTAVDLAAKSDGDANAKVFGELLSQDALKQTASVPPEALIEQRKIFRPFVWAVASLAIILGLGLFGPGVFRYGTKVLWVGWAQAKVSPLYQLQVSPGDIVVGRNSDQEILAQPRGFLPNTVRIFVLYQNNPAWESAAMVPQERAGSFSFLLTNVREPMEYYAESSGVRSQHYRVSVIDVPRVQRLEIRYHYPAYTGMKDTVEPSGGDIVALRGTQVTLIAHTDTAAPGGRMVLDDGTNITLKKLGDRELQATLPVSKDALYHIRLQDHLGREAKASEEYLIQALADTPPTLKIVRPGHDLQPSPIEEVVIGLQAQDDVRMRDLQLHYSVNGNPEQSVTLPRGNQEKEIAGSSTLSLEDFNLVPGDLISFYGVAKDAASNTAKTEMFFLQVRPFERNYTQAQAGGGAGGVGQENTFLSEKQKQVISATWNVLRKTEKDKPKPDQVAAQAQVLASVERTLLQQAENMAERTKSRELGGINEEFAALVDNLKKAAAAMEPAAGFLEKQKFQQALPPEQTALQHLMRAESIFRDIQVAFGSSGGGGGGGASRDLADLFALELDTGKNQYETLSQMGDQDDKAAVDEVMKKLEELARRQEDLSRREKENPKESLRAASRWEQEMLRRETEELARRLEQLSKETNSSQMSQASRALSQAARNMQQAGSQQQSGNQQQSGSQQKGSSQQQGSGQQGSGQQGGGQQQSGSQQQAGNQQNSEQRSERSKAEDRLREAGNLISGQQSSWDQESIKRLAENADELAREQQKIAEGVRRTAQGKQFGGDQPEDSDREGAGAQQGSQRGSQQGSQPGSERANLMQTLQSKQDLLNSLNSLERQLDEAAAHLAANQRKTAQQLRGASSFIQDQRMEDKIRQGAYLEQRGLWPMATPTEDDLKAGMNKLAERVKEAQKSLEQKGPDDKLQAALNLAERVRQGLESLERQRAGGQEGQGDQPGNRGSQPGQQGRQGQNGQQGQQGSQGQQGQQGQGGQQGQQGGQGGQGGQGSQSGQNGQGMSPGNSTSGQGGGPTSNTNGGGYSRGNLNLGPGTSNPMTPEEARQFAEGLQGLTREATGLRPLVSDDPELGKMAKELADAMENLSARKYSGNPANLDRLAANLIDQFKELELRLSRRLQGDRSDPVRLANEERVPDKYRAILEEYYRSLSKSPR